MKSIFTYNTKNKYTTTISREDFLPALELEP